MLICGNWTRHSCQNSPMRGHLGETLSPLTSLLDGVTLQQSPSLNEMLSEKCNSCSSTRRNMLASSTASVVRTYIITAPVSCLPFSQSPGAKDHTSVVAAMCKPPPSKVTYSMSENRFYFKKDLTPVLQFTRFVTKKRRSWDVLNWMCKSDWILFRVQALTRDKRRWCTSLPSRTLTTQLVRKRSYPFRVCVRYYCCKL